MSHGGAGDPLQELLKYAQLAGLSDDPGIRRLIDTLPFLSPERAQDRAARLLRHLSRLAAIRGAEDHPFLPQPEPEELQAGGDQAIVLGYLDDLNGGPSFSIPLATDSLLVHLLIAGPTGKGKTVSVLNVVTQLLSQKVPVHIFDTQGEYAHILSALQGAGVKVIRFGNFRRNPFESPVNIAKEEWLGHMSQYLREAFLYRDGTVNLFRDVCSRVLALGLPLNAQTFADEFHRTPQKSRRVADYFESLKRFVYLLQLPTYSCASGFSLVELSSQPVVFNLVNVPADLRLFFAADLVAWYHASRGYQPGRRVELVLVFDEMSEFFSKEAALRSAIKIPMPSKAGYELLDRYRVSYKVPQGNGSIAHRYWQHVISMKLQKEGWACEIELALQEKRVDVGAARGQEKVAYEVVMEGTLQKEVSNFEKDIKDGWDKVVFCVDSLATRERLAILLPQGDKRVEFRLLREFIAP